MSLKWQGVLKSRLYAIVGVLKYAAVYFKLRSYTMISITPYCYSPNIFIYLKVI